MLTARSLGPFLLGALAFLSACASRARVETLPRRYDCDGIVVVRGDRTATLATATAGHLRHDHEGDHYFVTAAGEATEYVLPDDRRLDGEVRNYAIMDWGEGSGWIPLGHGVCRSLAGLAP